MRNRIAVTLVLLSMLVALTVTTNPVSAANYQKIGVLIGDTAVYRSSFTGSTLNKTVIQVYGIVGTQVYLNTTNYYPNNTADAPTQSVTDIYAGSLTGWLYLIASDLTANDPVYSGSTYVINETVSMNIGGGMRTVNHLNGTSWAIPVDAYWDRTLGITVKLNFWFVGWYNYTMISFSSPGTPSAGLSTMTMIALAEGAVILVLLAYIVVSRRGSKGQARR